MIRFIVCEALIHTLCFNCGIWKDVKIKVGCMSLSLVVCRIGAALYVQTPHVPLLFSKLSYNPLCVFLFEDGQLSPELWHHLNVSEKTVEQFGCSNTTFSDSLIYFIILP